MGIGVWYEMFVSDPLAFLYKNADPRGSLRANVSNATVRCLSNMKLERMLEERHAMSQTVREEVSPRSQEWGYKTGSVYVRKVHFRDERMIAQIEQKVVNRLRQVTAAIQQDGHNRVNVIRSGAERQAAGEFAKAAAMRPNIVGEIDSLAMLMDAVDAGLGSTVQPWAAIARFPDGPQRFTLSELADAKVRRLNSLCSLSDDELSPAALAARVVVRDVTRQLVHDGRWPGTTLHES